MTLTESTVEEATIEWFPLRRLLRQGSEGHEGYGGQVGDQPSPRLRLTGLGHAIGHGPEMAAGEVAAERETFGDVVLEARLREALWCLNPGVPAEAREEVLRRVLRLADGTLVLGSGVSHSVLRVELGLDHSLTEALSS